jgi:hypothetical protein
MGTVFKNMHWPGASLLLFIAGMLCVVLIPIIFLKTKYKYNAEFITLKERLAKLSGATILIFSYFGFWGIYTMSVAWGIVPGFYNLSRPPAVVKMEDERVYDRSEFYWEGYNNFLEGRREAELNEGKVKAAPVVEEDANKVSVAF